MTALQVSTSASETGATVLILAGDLDVASAETLTAAVGAESGRPADLVLNLAAVTFLDSSGLGALITLHNDALARGGHLVLEDASSAVQRVLSLVGMTEFFETRETASE